MDSVDATAACESLASSLTPSWHTAVVYIYMCAYIYIYRKRDVRVVRRLTRRCRREEEDEEGNEIRENKRKKKLEIAKSERNQRGWSFQLSVAIAVGKTVIGISDRVVLSSINGHPAESCRELIAGYTQLWLYTGLV